MKFTLHISTDSKRKDIKERCCEVLAEFLKQEGYFSVEFDPNELNTENYVKHKVMEENKAPEKLYIDSREHWRKSWTAFTTKAKGDDIEYTRTDAFIKKACEWLMTHSEDDYFELIKDANYCGACNLNKKRMIEDFKEYLKK